MAGNNWDNIINDAINGNPRILNSPGLASDAVNSPDPHSTAMLLTHTAMTTGIQQAAQDYVAENPTQTHWWDGALHAVAKGGEWLSKPLNEIQKDYKFIHSLYTRHGVIAGALGTLAVAGGAGAGFALGAGLGAAAGADFAAAGLRHLVGRLDGYQNSYKDSEDENYKVSFGRDAANMFGANGQTDKGWAKYVSGALDATFDMALDPLIKVGSARTAIKTGKWVASKDRYIPIAFRSAGAQQYLERNSIKVFSPDQLDALYQAAKNPTLADRFAGTGRQYLRALEELGNKDFTAADVVRKYPMLRGSADEIGKAIGPDEVHDIIRQTWHQDQMIQNAAVGGTPIIPSRTVLRAAAGKVADKMLQPGSLDDEAYNLNNAAKFFVRRNVTQTVKDPITGLEKSVEKTILPVAMRPFSKEAWVTALAQKTRTFSGYMPWTIDEATNQLSTKTFDPNSKASLGAIYSVARYAMGHNAAKKYVNEFASAQTLEDKRAIYLGLVHETLKAAGFPNDEAAMARTMATVNLRGTPTFRGTRYAHGLKSEAGASKIEVDGATVDAAITGDQVGNWSFPDFRQYRRAMKDMGTYGKLYGRIDDFIADRWTNSIFKPFALLTGGFGLRIAASELIPTMVRFGGIETVNAMIAKTAQKMNVKLLAGEGEHVMAHIALQLAEDPTLKASELMAEATSGMTGVRKVTSRALSKLATAEDINVAARIALTLDGHMATGATSNGHGFDEDLAEQAKQIFDLLTQESKTRMTADPNKPFRSWSQGEPHFNAYWFSELNKDARVRASSRALAVDHAYLTKQGLSGDELEHELIRRESARIANVEYDPFEMIGVGEPLAPELDVYAAEREKLVRYKHQDPVTFATDRVDDFLNRFTGTDGTVHHKLIEKVANGQKIVRSDIADIPIEARPARIIGPELIPYVGDNVRNRIIQTGFTKVIDPIVNSISREPMFHLHVKDSLRSYQRLVDAGTITDEQAMQLSLVRATQAMVPQIHNVALRSQFAVLAQNFLPFYFAQEQATKRYIKLAADNPQALRTFQLINHAMHDPGFVETDSQGNRFITLPLVGEIGAGVLSGASALGLPLVGGLPVSVKGNVESLKTVLPEMQMPGVSPMVSIAGNYFASLDPAMAKYIKAVIGDVAFGQNPLDALIPNAPARSWFKALTADERDRTFSNAMLSAIAAANYHGQLPTEDASPMERQQFLDRIKNNARSILIIKGILGVMSPLAPQVSAEDPGLRDEFYQMVKQYGDYPTALHEFLGKHGNNAVSYTVARTESAVPGANMPYTNEAFNWLKENESLVNSKYSAGAMFLVPQAGQSGDVQLIHDELLKMHMRGRRSSEDFMTALYTAAGNNQYYADKAIHDQRVKELGNNKSALDQENQNWADYKQQFANANPVWANEFFSADKRNLAQRAYENLTEMFSKGIAPAGRQTDLVKGLMADYQQHQINQAQIRNSSSSNRTLSQEDDNWQNYLDALAAQQPELSTVINGIFRRLG